MLLSNASVDGLQDGVLTLRFVSEGEARGFLGSGYDADLKNVLATLLGITPQIRTASGAGDGGRSAAGPSSGSGPGAASDPGRGAPRAAGAGGGGRRSGSARAGGASSGVRAGGAGGVAGQPESADDDIDAGGLAGMDLIQRELGGQVIGEIVEP